MTRIRLILSDVDGTLVRHDKSLSPTNRAAVAEAMAAGISVGLISARPPSGVLPLVRALGCDAPCGAFNGATIFAPDGKILEAERLAPEAARSALEVIAAHGSDAWLYADGHWYASDLGNGHIARETLSAGVEPTPLDSAGDAVRRADKIVAVEDDAARMDEVVKALSDALGREARVGLSQDYYADVVAPGGSKGRGVERIARRLGLDPCEVAVLGDHRNDLSMFKVAGLSIAMGQAASDVQEAATHVAASNEEDGVADAIRRFIL